MNMKIRMPKRGEVWWVHLDPTSGSEINKTRPCLVVTTNVLNERRRTVVVIPLSTSPSASPPLMVALSYAGTAAVAVIDQIRVVSKDRLEKLIEQISPEGLVAVEEALRGVLDLN
jgi:mRNA interferase MazF